MEQAQLALLHWFERHGRHHLPWRQTRDPYKIYISEIMLQQTQVERVKEYYHRFLSHFPSLAHLAQASLDEVLALWSGLGYYRRARNLHATAKLCPHGLPKSYEELRALPGIGEYTAAAICSFAYDEPIPVVDTNIARVLRRFFGDLEGHKRAKSLLNPHAPKAHNLALMDLGSILCTPKDPFCSSCPLNPWCEGKEAPWVFTSKKTIKREAKTLHLAFWIDNGTIALTRAEDGLYSGLLTLPPIEPRNRPLGSFKHSYTRYNLTIYLYAQEPKGSIEWVALSQLHRAPVNAIVKKAVALAPF